MNATARLRFKRVSLRTLLLITALIAAFLAGRRVTRMHGEDDVKRFMAAHDKSWRGSPKYYLPFVLECSTVAWGPKAKTAITNRYYYFWCFGWISELPITRKHIDSVTADRTMPMIVDDRLLNRGF